MSRRGEDPVYFSDLDLSRRLEKAEAHANAMFVEARARTSPLSGACWIDVAGTYAMYDGVGSPVTQTFGLGLFEAPTAAALDELERFFLVRSAPVFHEVSPLAGLPALALLNERGYRPVELTSVMYRPLAAIEDSDLGQGSRIRVRPIEKHEGEVWARTTARGWSEVPELKDFLLALAPLSTERQDSISFLAEMASEPVATGVLCLGGGVALLGGACTVPEARKQGAQSALLASRLRYAKDEGCDVAMICTQPGSASQRNAERNGFRIAYTRIKWGLAPALPASTRKRD
jgi:GNAT superfamily N-acetyltransferase